MNTKMITRFKYKRHTTHNIKQLGFSGLRGFGSRINFFQRWIGTRSENPTVSYCQTLYAMGDEIAYD